MLLKLLFLLSFSLFNHNNDCKIDFRNSRNINSISKIIKSKKGEVETDTLRVSQSDTTVFRKYELIVKHPCSNPKLSIKYFLITPINNAYYFIYNEKQQLIKEGKYTYIDESGNFYNSKDYYYHKNGCLDMIHYMVNGRSYKTEYFDRKKRVKKIHYFDKSSDVKKIEIYKKGELKETRIYTSFNNYYKVKS